MLFRSTAAQRIEQHEEMPRACAVSSAVFLLKDGACQNFDVSCPVLWVSSPRMGSFQKGQRDAVLRLILAPWTADELVAYWQTGCASLRLFELSPLDQNRWAREAMLHVCEASAESGVMDEARQELIVRRWAADLGPVAPFSDDYHREPGVEPGRRIELGIRLGPRRKSGLGHGVRGCEVGGHGASSGSTMTKPPSVSATM